MASLGGRRRTGGRLSDRARGTLITVGGVLILSPDAALVDLARADTAALVFWRGVGMALVASAGLAVTRGRAAFGDLASTGMRGVLLVLCLMVTQFAWVAGVHMTNPAHVLVLVATSPLFGALFSRLLLGERVRPATVAAILVALLSVAITVSGSLKGSGGSIVGDLAAITAAAAMGLAFTLIRQMGLANAWPQFALAGLANAALAAAFHPVTSVEPAGVVPLAILVLVVLPVAFMLISTGPRLIPAPEVALIMLLEVPFGAIFLWLLADLAPTIEAAVGGALLVAALAAHAIWVGRHPRPA